MSAINQILYRYIAAMCQESFFGIQIFPFLIAVIVGGDHTDSLPAKPHVLIQALKRLGIIVFMLFF